PLARPGLARAAGPVRAPRRSGSLSLGAAYLRLGAALAALAAGAVAVVTIALLLHKTPGPAPSGSGAPAAPPAPSRGPAPAASRSLPNAIATPASPGFPAPPRGAVVFSGEDDRAPRRCRK